MVLEFEFPDTGEGVTEGQFLEWLVEEGEEVEEDQPLAEVETDKAVIEVPAPADGTIKSLKAKPGDVVKVGQVILEMDTGGETAEQPLEEKDTTESEKEQETVQEEAEPEEREEDSGEEKTESRTGSSEVLALPKVRKLAEEKDVNIEELGPGRVTEEDVLQAAEEESGQSEPAKTEETSAAPQASPSVRQLAREKDVDLSKVEGSGRGGTITRNDVIDAAGQSTATGVSRDEPRPEGGEERVPMTNIHKVTAEKMTESRFTAPHVTHMDTADITELVEKRNELKEEVDVHLTYLPFIMKACVQALREYPKLNAELDDENDEILQKYYYNFNIAVDTERGLMVPVIESVGEKNMLELAADITEKVEKAQNHELSPGELQGGTFSITNLGVIGGEGFTPIINPPQTAILGIGRIQEEPRVVDGEVVPRHTVKLSLSYDHRVVDGATAARFMNRIIENLENPEKMLLELR